MSIYHDDNVINILLLGTDERTDEFNENARAVAIMVMSLNTKEHTIKLIGIERGIGVPVPGRNDDWITHTFSDMAVLPPGRRCAISQIGRKNDMFV